MSTNRGRIEVEWDRNDDSPIKVGFDVTVSKYNQSGEEILKTIRAKVRGQ